MKQKINCIKVRALIAFLFLSISGSVLSQKKVTGIVLNAKDKQPVAFATIMVKGTNVATATTTTGLFIITLPEGKNVLIISNVGFDDAEVNITTSDNIKVELKEKTSSLDEIIVTGYSAQKKKDLTGAVSVVNVKDLKSIPAGSPEQMLQGRASGLNIITSGQPGSESTIRIRGITSFGDATPLVIVDGVPSSLKDINANDIESIQVLKDAGAASIYGVRGSNGVIVVTTKRGKSGKATLTYDAYYGSQRPLKGNVFNLLNTQGMADVTWLALRNSGQIDTINNNPVHPQYGNGVSPTLPDYILLGENSGVSGQPSAADLAAYNIDYNKGDIFQIIRANKTGTDWFHQIFSPAPIQSHSLTASGGSDKSTYLFSLGYFNQQGTLLNTYLKRYSVRVNNTFNIKNNIRIGENAYLFYKDNPQIGNQDENNPISMSYREQPIIPVYDINGGFAGTAAKGLGNAENPYANLARTANNKGNTWDITGNIFAEIDLLQHFTIRSSFGGTIDNGYYYSYGYHTYENAENNGSNSFSENAYYNRSWTWTNTINYSNVFAQKHSIKILAGIEAIEDYGRSVGGGALGYFTDLPSYWILSNGSSGYTNYSGVYQEALYSQFGKFDYAYDSKYLISATLRRDGSSKFAAASRYGVFPSFSAAWRLSRESFMTGVSWINDLKLRGSWGSLGSQLNVNSGNAFPLLYNGSPGTTFYPIDGTNNSAVPGIAAVSIGNPATSWEKDKLLNFGIDATLLNNRLDFSIEWYKKTIAGLLFADQVPATVGGASLPIVNIGDVQNKGIDFSATWHGSPGNNFKYDITGIFTTYKSNITRIPGDYFDAGDSRIGSFVRNETGHPIGSFFGYEVIGLFQSDDDVLKSPVQDAAAPGRFKYKDLNGDGEITDDDRTFFGNPNPSFTYGLNIEATYNGFDFSIFFYGSQGNDVINYVKYWTDFYPSFQGVKSIDLLNNSWTPNNPNAATPIAENESNFSNNGVVNSYYKEDGSYLRCKSIIIGYTLPSKGLKRFGIDKFRVFIQAANLFTLTKYTGLDPELSGSNAAFGIDYGNYPNNQKNYNVGISLSF